MAALILAIGLVAGAAFGSRNARPNSKFVTCPGHNVSFAFDPKRGVVVKSGTRVLATASLRGSTVSGACKGVADPHAVVGMAEPNENLYRTASITCRVAVPLRIYLAPGHNGRASVRNILVIAGDPPRTVVGAVLTGALPATPLNIHRRRVPFLYRKPGNCRE